MRTRSGSTTEKWPAQSSRLASARAAMPARSDGSRAPMRRRMTPADADRPERKANSPKSLSNVRTIRPSEAARLRISPSALPGASVRIQTTSCPSSRSTPTIYPGMFSFARIRNLQDLGFQGIDLLSVKSRARIPETRLDVLAGQGGVVRDYRLFRTSLRQEIDDEFNGEARSLNDGLACQHFRPQLDSLLPAQLSFSLRPL